MLRVREGSGGFGVGMRREVWRMCWCERSGGGALEVEIWAFWEVRLQLAHCCWLFVLRVRRWSLFGFWSWILSRRCRFQCAPASEDARMGWCWMGLWHSESLTFLEASLLGTLGEFTLRNREELSLFLRRDTCRVLLHFMGFHAAFVAIVVHIS